MDVTYLFPITLVFMLGQAKLTTSLFKFHISFTDMVALDQNWNWLFQ